MSLLAVGTVAFDTVETPFGKAERILGGSATYITLAARFFSDDVRMNAVVGRDFPDTFVELLRERGVNLDGLVRDDTDDSFFWAGRYHYDLNQRDTLATHLNVLANFEPDLPLSYRTSNVVCLGNLDPTVQINVLNQVEKPDLVVLDTMNYWIANTPDALKEVLRRVDVLAINDAEARELSGEPNLVKAARIIRSMGPKTLIIKKGEHGALLFTGDTIFSAPGFPLEDIHDPTGAGDTFLGGFAGYLARTAEFSPSSFKRAVVMGSALASFVVQAFGPEQLLGLTHEQVDDRVAAFHHLSSVPEGLLTGA